MAIYSNLAIPLSLNISPPSETKIDSDDVLLLNGNSDDFSALRNQFGHVLTDTVVHEPIAGTNAGFFEVIIKPKSKFLGNSISQLSWTKYCKVLSVSRRNATINPLDRKFALQAGDFLFCYGHSPKLNRPDLVADIVVVEPPDSSANRTVTPSNHKIVLALVGLTILVMISGIFPIPLTLLAATTALLLYTKVSIERVYREINWGALFLIAALFPLSVILQTNGVGSYFMFHLSHLVAGASELQFHFYIAVSSTLLGLLLTNSGATVMFAPLAIQLASACGISESAAALNGAIASSNCFILPNQQVNSLVQRAAHYSPIDFIKSGLPMTILYMGAGIISLTIF